MENNLIAGVIRKVTNARKKTFEKKLPIGKTANQVLNEEVEKLKMYHIILDNCIEYIFTTAKAIDSKIDEIEVNTKQHLEKDQLAKEVWILRYAFLYSTFFKIKEPHNENEVTENIKLIDNALQNVLNRENKSSYLSWLLVGLAKYVEVSEIKYSNLKEFETYFTEQVAENIPLIAFNCTGGRLAGEQHDSVINLIMTTVERDRIFFQTGRDGILNKNTEENIKKILIDLKLSREKAAEDFFNSLNSDTE